MSALIAQRLLGVLSGWRTKYEDVLLYERRNALGNAFAAPVSARSFFVFAVASKVQGASGCPDWADTKFAAPYVHQLLHNAFTAVQSIATEFRSSYLCSSSTCPLNGGQASWVQPRGRYKEEPLRWRYCNWRTTRQLLRKEWAETFHSRGQPQAA